MPMPSSSAPSCSDCCRGCCPKPSGSPGATSSSPVTSSATRGRRATRTFASPHEAIRPSRAALRISPAHATVAPEAMSSPAGAHVRAVVSPAGTTMTSPSTRTRSLTTTVSAPIRQRRAGRDAHAFAGADAQCRVRAGEHDADHAKTLLAFARKIVAAQCVAIHRRVSERRNRIRSATSTASTRRSARSTGTLSTVTRRWLHRSTMRSLRLVDREPGRKLQSRDRRTSAYAANSSGVLRLWNCCRRSAKSTSTAPIASCHSQTPCPLAAAAAADAARPRS